MARRDSKEYWEARTEILRRAAEAGLDEDQMDTLLYAFEAATLRSYKAYLTEPDEVGAVGALEAWASGTRPRGWRKLLPAKAVSG